MGIAHMQMRSFWLGITANWFVAMSGGASVPLAIAGIYATSDLVKAGFEITAYICVILAAIGTWRKEHAKLISLRDATDTEIGRLNAQVINLQAQIDFLSKPQFSIQFFNVMLGDDPGVNGSHVVLFFRLNNVGTKAAAISSEWKLRVNTKDGSEFRGNPAKVEPKIRFPTNGQWGRVYISSDWILDKAAGGVDRFGSAEGILVFLLPGMDCKVLMDDSTTLTVSGEAVGGAQFSQSVKVGWFRANSTDKFNTSLAYPHDVLMKDHGG